MADAKDIVERLCKAGIWLDGEGEEEHAWAASDAGDLIDEQAAENERLKAELERLTPKPMTLERAVALMNEIAYDGVEDWQEDEDGMGYVFSPSADDNMGSWLADAIGQQIEREQAAEDKSPLDSMMSNSATYIPQGPEREKKEADRA